MSERIQRAAIRGTALFAVVSIVAAIVPNPIAVLAVAIDLGLFVLGCVAFVLTLAGAATRSRTDQLTLFGIWWLEGTAPPAVRRRLLGALAAQIVVAIATAAAQRVLAFGILVPVFGLGLTGLWSVRLGAYPPRV